jgi:hypothetical protein
MIKKTVCLLALTSLLFTISCKKQEETPKVETPIESTNEITVASEEVIVPVDGKYPVLSFEKTEHDFGTIEKESKVDYTFRFKNTGDADLLITNAIGSCGRTVPEYPKGAIKPGAEEQIKVSFNSAGKKGQQQKSVTLSTNTKKGAEILTIKASIKE